MPIYQRNEGLFNFPCSSPDLTPKGLVDKTPLSLWGEGRVPDECSFGGQRPIVEVFFIATTFIGT